jgi:hypothetical protein
MTARREAEDRLRKSRGTLSVPLKLVKNNTGTDGNHILSAEGSLNQHIKLKHPELVKDRGIFFKSSEISNAQQDGDVSESQVKKDN